MAKALRPLFRSLGLLVLASSLSPLPVLAQTTARDAVLDWEVSPGFRIDSVASGFDYPTAIAFVPNPGSLPKDPLYFVTELHGRVKVVTNDGTISIFARDFAPTAVPAPRLDEKREVGTAGLCLDSRRGFVFVTFGYLDSMRLVRNGIVRFETRPGTFAVSPSGQRAIAQALMSADTSADSHQVGPCQVDGDFLYVAVGDAERTAPAHVLESSLGKVLRMTVDGAPAPGNPHGGRRDRGASPYVWVSGVRNIFSLRVVDGRVFAADNGPLVDRFLELRSGDNLGWDGTDWSIGMNALMVFSPPIAPVQLDYYPEGATLFPPEYRRRFYLASSGRFQAMGVGRGGSKSIITLDVDFTANRLRATPKLFARYAGTGSGSLVSLAFGPDGLYFAPLLPGAGGSSSLFRIAFAPDRPHPKVIGAELDAVALLWSKGCRGCHARGGIGGTAGPPLDARGLPARLAVRLQNDDYIDSLEALNARGDDLSRRTRPAREAVAAVTGHQRIREWITQRVLEPKFDSPNALMPRLGLTEPEARAIADHLAGPPPVRRSFELPPSRYRHVAAAFVVGAAFTWLLGRLVRARRIK